MMHFQTYSKGIYPSLSNTHSSQYPMPMHLCGSSAVLLCLSLIGFHKIK